jgi:Flp pilus assembly protein TadD
MVSGRVGPSTSSPTYTSARPTSELADEALRNTRERAEAVLEAWALRLAAEVTTHREPLDAARAEGLYRDAIERAEGLGVRPLTARCHLGLGALYDRTGKAHDARVNLSTAARLFREMQMRLWSDRADAELRLLAH